MSRAAVPARIRWRILVRDGFACRYCGRSPKVHGVALEVDHVKAVVAGGSNDEENLVTACDDCNRGKHDQPLGYVVPDQPARAIICMAAVSAIVEYPHDDVAGTLPDILLLAGHEDADDVLDIVLNAGSWPDVRREIADLVGGRHVSRVN